MLLLALVFWKFQELQRSQLRSFCGDGEKTSLIFGRFSLKHDVGSLWRFFYFFARLRNKILVHLWWVWGCLWLGYAMGTQIHRFGALWENRSGGKIRVDVHRVMSNWSLPCGFEVDLSLSVAWIVLCALKLEILEAIWVDPTQRVRGLSSAHGHIRFGA